MLTKTFAAVATTVLAATTATAGISDWRKESPINLDHSFYEVPDTTISLEACTADRHLATIHGVIYADKTEQDARNMNGLPVKQFRHNLQIAYANALVQYKNSELKLDTLMPGNFKDFGEVFSEVTRTMKTQGQPTLVFMPRAAIPGPFTENCPAPVLKK